jgi:CHAD domain-containing protein
MEAKTLLIEALDVRWRKFRAERKTCRKEFSEEAVHDLRVATRRLLALFDLLRSILHHKRIQKIRRMLKGQLDDLDELRDTQVLLADVSEFVQELPALQAFQTALKKKEKKLLRQTRKAIETRDVDGLKKHIENVRGMLVALAEESLQDAMLAAADERFAHALHTYAAMDTENVPSIHRLRVAFKKFRYTFEIVHPILKNFPESNFKRMHDYQSMLGDIQDLDVALQSVSDVLDASDPAVQPVSDHYASRLRTAVFNFVEDKGEMFTFWRNAPNQSFPWELLL